MKLFAPRNDWTMSSPGTANWWNMAGTYGTSAGIRIDESTALTFSAVFSATRVISETMASLPCNLLEQVDARTTNKATSHPLWKVMHDEPNPEQDIMSWLDSQVAFQVNWGNSYSEIIRNTRGEVVALWPIHPSRIPLRNIKRNTTYVEDYDGIDAGQPGEIVYYVNNDDGSKSPIAARDMLHVPGVLSTNGVTGQSIIKWGANSIGNAIAADQHAGAIFKNGAVTNIVLKHPKIIGPEAAERLRRQWQTTFGGVQNHYKTLLLEEGMEPVPINMNPDETQLLATRQFSVTEIARWYRLPPHLLGDLTRSSFSNIEQQNLDFIVYSLTPWIVRWEKAMQRQLLTAEEKKQYRFKFNINGLLRGDAAARASFYRTMFDLGAMSPNDIRNSEDMNPTEYGDQYFVQGNNAVPLEQVGDLAAAHVELAEAQAELAEANAEKAKEPTPTPVSTPMPAGSDAEDDTEEDAPKNRMAAMRQQMDAMIEATERAAKREINASEVVNAVKDSIGLAVGGEVSQMMRYEIRAIRDAAKKPGVFLQWRDDFYAKFAEKLAAAVNVFHPAAEKIGLQMDAEGESRQYVADSIADLESLLDLPASNLESGVNDVVSKWENRPRRMAEALIRTSA